MQVNQYLFQSPSTSQVQVGRLDPSSKETERTSETTSQQNIAISKQQPVHPTQVETTSVEQSVEPTISSKQLLDVYA